MREHSRMGFNRRKMDDERRRAAEKKAAEQRATVRRSWKMRNA
jgi:hypothetical protein